MWLIEKFNEVEFCITGEVNVSIEEKKRGWCDVGCDEKKKKNEDFTFTIDSLNNSTTLQHTTS